MLWDTGFQLAHTNVQEELMHYPPTQALAALALAECLSFFICDGQGTKLTAKLNEPLKCNKSGQHNLRLQSYNNVFLLICNILRSPRVEAQTWWIQTSGSQMRLLILVAHYEQPHLD